MSSLRRRIFGHGHLDSSPEQSRTPSPPATVDKNGRKVDPVPVAAATLDKMKRKQKASKRRYAWIFGLGGLFGIFVAAFFAKENDMIDMTWMGGMSLDSIIDVLPAGLINDAREFQVSDTRLA